VAIYCASPRPAPAYRDCFHGAHRQRWAWVYPKTNRCRVHRWQPVTRRPVTHRPIAPISVAHASASSGLGLTRKRIVAVFIGGNLLRVAPSRTGLSRLFPWRTPPPALGYVDFGLVSRVPVNVREGLICAVAQLLFARDTAKVNMLICIYYLYLIYVVYPCLPIYLSIYMSFYISIYI